MSGYQDRKLSIVIPCLNEEAAVPFVLSRALALRSELNQVGVSSLEIIVVDDGSADSSRRAVTAFEGVRLISNEQSLGYGAALKRGITESEGDLIAFYDMDHTYDPFDLLPMVRELDEKKLTVVSGDRLSRCENMPLTRQIGNGLFVGTINFLFRKKVLDSCSGLRVFQRHAQESFTAPEMPDNLNYTLAMTMHCLSQGIPIGEIPIRYDKRIGRSKLSVLVDGPRFFLTIMKHWSRHESRHFVRRMISN